jgi:hypothetical protein
VRDRVGVERGIRGGQRDGDLAVPEPVRADPVPGSRCCGGGDRAVFSTTGRVNREDFGITWNMALETGGILVSKDIDLDIEVETVREVTQIGG